MKKLYNINTECIQDYPRMDDLPVEGLDSCYEIFDEIFDDKPAFDPTTQFLEESVEINVPEKQYIHTWNIITISVPNITRKMWMNSAKFVAEFTMQELAQIGLSVDPTIAALRLILSTWSGAVWSDDSRVTQGLTALQTANIISTDRLNEIIHIS